MATTALPRRPTLAMGVLSIVAFGAWFYGYGVLVEPIRAETGWSEGLLGGIYGVSLLVSGVAGTAVGRALDLRGSRVTFVVLALATPSLLIGASATGRAWLFAVLATTGGGLVGAGGYYNATSAIMARLVPEQRARGITVLTLWGAFASPVFLPLIGWLVPRLGWRTTLRGLALAVGVAYLATALAVPDVRPEAVHRPPLREALRATLAGPARRALVVAVMVAGAVSALVLVQQVPAMTGAGMALGTASTVAGARGLLQLAGRVPLSPVVLRLGSRRTLRGAYLLMGGGALLLIGAGGLLQASVYAVVAGIGIGAMSAVESIHAADVFDGPAMGTHLGMLGLLRGVGAAVGPTVGGIAVDVTETRAPALVLAAAGAILAAGVLTPRTEPARPADQGDADV